MKTCKDCLHYEVCADLADQFIKTFPDQSANGCENFKDGSRFEEVVRCKDCKRCEKRIDARCGMVFVCNMFNSQDARRYRNPKGFCSGGERRMGDA